jgi:hypothetical protein
MAGIILLVFAFVVCGGIAAYFVAPEWLGGDNAPAENVAKTRVEELREKSDTWKDQQAALGTVLERLQSDKQVLAAKLRAAGVQSAGDLSKDDPQTRLLATELVEVEKQIRAVDRKSQAYESAIDRMDSIVRRLERKAMIADAGISEDELAEVAETTMQMDQDLQDALAADGGSAELELEAVLNDVLEGTSR